MKINFWFVRISAISLLFFAATSEGGVNTNAGTLPDHQGSYCNATTYDGAWAMFASEEPLEFNCGRVDRWLRRNSGMPVEHRISGGYNTDAQNDVWLDCRRHSQGYRGFGLRPLRRAFHMARDRRLRDCLFFVNWR